MAKGVAKNNFESDIAIASVSLIFGHTTKRVLETIKLGKWRPKFVFKVNQNKRLKFSAQLIMK